MPIDDWSLADVKRMIGAPWNPPPADKPATRTLYFCWVSDRIAEATGELCAGQWLIGGIPRPLHELDRETYKMRMAHSEAELRVLAKAEMAS